MAFINGMAIKVSHTTIKKAITSLPPNVCFIIFLLVNKIVSVEEFQYICGMKTCSECQIPKDSSEFYPDKRNKLGLRSTCKECDSLANKTYLATDNGKVSSSARSKRYRSNNSQIVRDRLYLKKYGISFGEKLAILEKQDNKCKICNTLFPSLKHAKLDHDHKTGKIRGILCNTCNRAIGLLKDDLNVLKSAIEYLESI